MGRAAKAPRKKRTEYTRDKNGKFSRVAGVSSPNSKPKAVVRKKDAAEPKLKRSNQSEVPDAGGKLRRTAEAAGTRENPHLFNDTTEMASIIAFGHDMTTQEPSVWRETPEGSEQVDAIIEYTSGNTEAMNHYLRTGTQLEGMPVVSDDQIAKFDSAFESEHVRPIEDWVGVSRGGSLADYGIGEGFTPEEFSDMVYNKSTPQVDEAALKGLVGKTFTNKAYTSTSLADRPAMSSQVRTIFRLPPGTRGLYVAGDGYAHAPLTRWGEELEVILPRNLKYKIVSAGRETATDDNPYAASRFRNEYLIVAEVILEDENG